MGPMVTRLPRTRPIPLASLCLARAEQKDGLALRPPRSSTLPHLPSGLFPPLSAPQLLRRTLKGQVCLFFQRRRDQKNPPPSGELARAMGVGGGGGVLLGCDGRAAASHVAKGFSDYGMSTRIRLCWKLETTATGQTSLSRSKRRLSDSRCELEHKRK